MFVLCDAAVDQMGKMSLLGTFDSIYAENLPIVYPQCAIAMRIRFESVEQGDHPMKLSIIDADGNTIVPPVDTTIRVQFPPNVSTHAYNIVLNLQRTKFEHFGEYAVNLAVNGRQEASIPLHVRQRQPQNPGGGGPPLAQQEW
jgi:hypothetical protein